MQTTDSWTDANSVEETLNHLRQMAAENVGFFLLHDVDAALKVANRIAIFYWDM